MSDSHGYESEDTITRDGVMADFWRSRLQKWVGVPVCVNAGDAVFEGRLVSLGNKELVLEALIGTGVFRGCWYVSYDDIVSADRINAAVLA